MLQTIPTAVLLHMSLYLDSPMDLVPLSCVCRAWERALSKNNPDLWLTLSSLLRVDVSSENVCKISLRSRTDYKKIFLRQYRKQQRMCGELHSFMLLRCKDMLSKSKVDSPQQLVRCIAKSVPLSCVDINYSNDMLERNTLLHIAARLGKFKCARHLVEQMRAEADCRDVGGITPLMIFAYRGDLRAVRWLVRSGASVGLRGSLRSGLPLTAEQLAATSPLHEDCRAVFHFLRSVRLRASALVGSVTVSSGSDALSPERKRDRAPISSAWCICSHESCFSGLMVACDNALCSLEWYHLDCVGLSAEVRPPPYT